MGWHLASRNSILGCFICNSPYEVLPASTSRFSQSGPVCFLFVLIGLDYANLTLKVCLSFLWWFYPHVFRITGDFLFVSPISLFFCFFLLPWIGLIFLLIRSILGPHGTKLVGTGEWWRCPKKMFSKNRLWMSPYSVSGLTGKWWSGPGPAFRVKAKRYILKMIHGPQHI